MRGGIVMKNKCKECAYFEWFCNTKRCKKANEMTMEEFEDYFVDNVKKCPHFKEDDND